MERIEKIKERDKTAVLYEPHKNQNKNQIYPNQIEAFQKIIEQAPSNPYISLVAQMQSGKTDTFLLCAFEYLRLEMVDHVTIFSGNSDLELKRQTIKSINDFGFKYVNYLEDYIEIPMRTGQELYQTLKSNIKVVWSSELNKQTPKNNTLFIWEESHYAQSVEMLPHDFLKTMQLSPSGDSTSYFKKKNYFLSVSATPFSEIVNIIEKSQDKKIVYLNPGPNYYGVQYFLENGIIQPHDNSSSDLSKAIVLAEYLIPNRSIYGIIRCYGKQEEEFIGVANTRGWDIKYFNLEKKDIIDNDIGLHTAPPKNTLVFIKGALRMGKQVSKKHIGFVFETTGSPNTDTILQGLLGRMCTFEPIPHIRIYIHSNILVMGELEKYIEFIKELENGLPLTTIPSKAMNIKNKKFINKGNGSHYSPIFVPSEYITVSGRTPLFACLSCIFNDPEQYPLVQNNNNDPELLKILSDTNFYCSVHKLSKKSNKRKLEKLMGLNDCIQMGNHHQELWIVDTLIPEYPSLKINDCFITIPKKPTIDIQQPLYELQVTTTQQEVFSF
jgi:hypothetical protein